LKELALSIAMSLAVDLSTATFSGLSIVMALIYLSICFGIIVGGAGGIFLKALRGHLKIGIESRISRSLWISLIYARLF